MFNTLSSDAIKNGDNSGVGGGGGLSVNSMLPINSPDDLYEAPDGSEWLKTGTVAEDTAGEYPDATVTAIGVYTGTNFSVSQDASQSGHGMELAFGLLVMEPKKFISTRPQVFTQALISVLEHRTATHNV